MCTPTSRIVFCTCEDTERHNPSTIIWTLHRSIRKIITLPEPTHPEMIIGTLFVHYNSLVKVPTELKVLQCLNETDPFDFDYEPQTGDVIEISKSGGIMLFRYQGNEWVTSKDHLYNYVGIADGCLHDLELHDQKIAKQKIWTDEELVAKANQLLISREPAWKTYKRDLLGYIKSLFS